MVRLTQIYKFFFLLFATFYSLSVARSVTKLAIVGVIRTRTYHLLAFPVRTIPIAYLRISVIKCKKESGAPKLPLYPC